MMIWTDALITIMTLVAIYTCYRHALKNQREYAEQLTKAYNDIKGFSYPEENDNGQD